MTSALWNKEKRAGAQQVLGDLLSEWTKTGCPLRLQNMLRMRVLAAWSDGSRLSRNDVLPVLGSMVKTRAKTVKAFEEHHARLIQARLSSRGKQRRAWRVLFPLKVQFQSTARRSATFVVLDVSFRITSWQAAERRYGKKPLRREADRVSRRTEPWKDCKCLVATTQAVDGSEANRRVSSAFEALRGIVESTHGFLRMSYSFPPQPRRRIAHPAWCLVLDPNNVAEGGRFQAEGVEQKTAFVLTEKAIQATKRNARCLQRALDDNSTLSLIADAMRLYAQAVDDPVIGRCLLAFWQMAEAMTLAREVGGDTKKVAARLGTLVQRGGYKVVGVRDILESIGQIRNEIVHRVILDQASHDDVNVLKACCELGLDWLFSNRRDLPLKQDLSEFFRLAESTAATLKSTERAVRHARRKRK